MADKNAPPPVPVTPAPSHRPAPTPEGIQNAEPVLTKNIATAIAAAVAWAVQKGVLDGDDETFASILIPIVALAVGTWWTRRSVTPVAKAQDAIELAYTAQPGQGAKPTL